MCNISLLSVKINVIKHFIDTALLVNIDVYTLRIPHKMYILGTLYSV